MGSRGTTILPWDHEAPQILPWDSQHCSSEPDTLPFCGQRDGFFVECGALDGETRSNTLFMERFLGWTGLLVEADPTNFRRVLSKRRNAWSVNVCLNSRRDVKSQVCGAGQAVGRQLGRLWVR